MIWLRFAFEQAYEGVQNIVGDPFSPEVLLTVGSVTAVCVLMQLVM